MAMHGPPQLERGSSMVFGGIRRGLGHMAIDESNDLRFRADRQFQRRFTVGNFAVRALATGDSRRAIRGRGSGIRGSRA